MDEPVGDDLKAFLDVWNRLCNFEASQRYIRGYGAFNPNELPIPAAVRVIKWMEQRVATAASAVKSV